MRRDSLEVLDQSMYPELWVYLDQQVYVVWHNLKGDNFCSEPQAGFDDEMPKPKLDFIDQNRSPILRAPDDVVLAGEDHIVVRLVVFDVHS
jgi:hypothetical protein